MIKKWGVSTTAKHLGSLNHTINMEKGKQKPFKAKYAAMDPQFISKACQTGGINCRKCFVLKCSCTCHRAKPGLRAM